MTTGSYATAVLPSLSTAYINRTGKLSASGLHYIFQTGSLATSGASSYLGNPMALMIRGLPTYIAAMRLTVHRRLHADRLAWPSLLLEVHDRIVHVGRSSFSTRREVRDTASGRRVLEAVVTAVSVDQDARRPTPLPEWFRDAVRADELSPALPYKRVPPPVGRPSRTFSTTFVVTVSDTDLNLHLNQAVFVRYAFDCAWEACKEEFFKEFSGDLCDFEIAEENITYMSEALLGETLTVHVWETEADRRIHSLIYRPNDRESCYVNFAFYPEQTFQIDSKL